MPSTVRRKRIRTIVEDLLKQSGETRPPVDVKRIAKLSGADVRSVPFAGDADDVSGMLYRDAHKTIIGVNESDHENRQRFTIAHELGHLHLHPVDRLHLDRNFRVAFRDSRSSTGADVREVEANEFAAELLMPAEMLRKDLEGRAIDIEDDSKLIEGLARTYQVSVQAMTYRLTNLGLIGAIVA